MYKFIFSEKQKTIDVNTLLPAGSVFMSMFEPLFNDNVQGACHLLQQLRFYVSFIGLCFTNASLVICTKHFKSNKIEIRIMYRDCFCIFNGVSYQSNV